MKRRRATGQKPKSLVLAHVSAEVIRSYFAEGPHPQYPAKSAFFCRFCEPARAANALRGVYTKFEKSSTKLRDHLCAPDDDDNDAGAENADDDVEEVAYDGFQDAFEYMFM